MGIIQAPRIPVPPLPLQDQFALLVARHERLRAVQRELLRQSEHLFKHIYESTPGTVRTSLPVPLLKFHRLSALRGGAKAILCGENSFGKTRPGGLVLCFGLTVKLSAENSDSLEAVNDANATAAIPAAKRFLTLRIGHGADSKRR